MKSAMTDAPRSATSPGADDARPPRKTALQAVRGMNDVLPDEAALWERFEETTRDVFRRYGYRNLRVPIVERFEQLGLALHDHLARARQLPPPGAREMDGVAAAVGRVPAALEQARALQVVDHRHQPARIEAHPFPQLLLGAAGATISEVEKREVRGSEPERLERLREAE